MKHCPTCLQHYADETLNFCLSDGTALIQTREQAEVETVIIPSKVSVNSPQLVRQGVNPVFAYLAIALLALVLGGGIVFWLKSDMPISNSVKNGNSDVVSPVNTNKQPDPIKAAETNLNRQIGEVKETNSASNTSGEGYKVYSNPRFGYSITYPSDRLEPQPVAANGDGREFLSSDRQTKMLVYGTENPNNQTLAQMYADEINKGGRTVTYKVLRGGFFAISGYDGSNIFYQKTLFKNSQFMTFNITYPTAQRNVYDRIVTRASKSFR